MKRSLNIILILFYILISVGCEDELINRGVGDIPEFTIEIPDNQIVTDGAPTQGTFEIKAIGSNAQWRIISKESWFKLKKEIKEGASIVGTIDEGTGSATVNYTVVENTGVEDLVGKIVVETFHLGIPLDTTEYEICQTVRGPFVEFTTNSAALTDITEIGALDLELSFRGNVESVSIAAKESAEVNAKDVDWITISQEQITLDEKKGKATFSIKPNATNAIRKAVFVLTSTEAGTSTTTNIELSQKFGGSELKQKIIMPNMFGYLPAGSGLLKVKPLGGEEKEISVNVEIEEGKQTIISLDSPLEENSYQLISYCATGGEAISLMTEISVNILYEISTAPWDNVMSMFGGDSPENAIIFTTEAQLQKLAKVVNEGSSYSGVYLKLGSDITLVEAWTPIGNPKNPFGGIFDGGNFSIYGLKIPKSVKQNQGFFGVINGSAEKRAEVRNLNIVGGGVGFDFTLLPGSYNIGAIAGGIIDNALIENCRSSLNIKASTYVGGIVGSMAYLGNEGFGGADKAHRNIVISSCHNTGNISAKNSGVVWNVGGIAGANYGVITKSSNSGKILNVGPSAGQRIGGIVGINFHEVSECYNTGEIGPMFTGGGVVGFAAVGKVDAPAVSSVRDCYNTGKVIAQVSTTPSVGGVVGGYGENLGCITTIQNCYNIGEITVSSVGGSIAGMLKGSDSQNAKATIRSLFASPQLSGCELLPSSNRAEGDDSDYPDIAIADRIFMKTADQMKKSETFTNVVPFTAGVTLPSVWNWDFNTIWTIDEGTSTPYLRNNLPIGAKPTIE